MRTAWFDTFRLRRNVVAGARRATAPRRSESARGNRARNHPPGPTKIENPPSGGFFGFRRVGLDENRMVRHIPTQEECGRGSPQGDGAPKG